MSEEKAGQTQHLRRVRTVAAHLAPKVVETTDLPKVSFDGKSFLPIEPRGDAGTISSPGRRAFPGMRRSTQQRDHLESRRKAETGSARLWRVHGKFYDLEPFLEVHPGGRRWLELTRGTDATQAFEAYHLDMHKVEMVLSRYYVRDLVEGEFGYGDRFTFAEDGFYRTLKRRALAKLKSAAGPKASTFEATSATGSMRIACAATVAQFVTAQAIAVKTGSAIAAAIAGLLFEGCWGVGHNFSHQSEEKAGLWSYAMDLAGSYSKDWQISHGLSHHLDTNLETDWEYNHLVPDIRDRSNKMGNAILASPLIMGPLLQMSGVSYLVSTAKEAALGKPDGKRWHHLLPGLFPIAQLSAYIHRKKSIAKGCALYCIQMAAFMILMTPIAGGVHHSAPTSDSEDAQDLLEGSSPRSTYAWHEGQAGAQIDWGAHQVACCTDHSTFIDDLPPLLANWLSLNFYGYLNNHTLHHLFPGVDHSRLHLLRGVMEETAKEFDIEIKNVQPRSVLALMTGYWRYHIGRRIRRSSTPSARL